MRLEQVAVWFALICIVFALAILVYTPINNTIRCEDVGGDFCLSPNEIECRDFCAPDRYYYEYYSGGLFGGSSGDCACKLGGVV